MREFLLIDGSYYIFYRYFALLSWWKHRNSDKVLDENPFNNNEFVSKFEKIFISKKNEIVKKLSIQNPIIIVLLDCDRCDIWRTELYNNYKDGRTNIVGIGEAFKYVFQENLFQKMGARLQIKHPKLEADDCVAITVKNIRRLPPTNKIFIITSDMDYLQIADDITIPINLKYKPLRDSKHSFKDNRKDLFCKIVMGDKSDNIPSVFKKCGIKTAEKYYNNMDGFKKKLEEDVEANKRYEFNKTLIDFDEIPLKYVMELNTGKFTETFASTIVKT
jgi:5'-3' exonuclease